ncbi:MAG: hypothetical protein IJN34_02745 [Clostridia bacterium]|nr:hypothetical protein [Clostridia bacterium]
MSDLNGNASYFRPAEDSNQDYSQSPAYPGSWQQVLRNNEGQYCVIDFLIGTDNLVQQEGVLYDVGVSFIVLFEPRTGNYIVCDLYSIKFVTFVGSGVLPTGKSNKRRL